MGETYKETIIFDIDAIKVYTEDNEKRDDATEMLIEPLIADLQRFNKLLFSVATKMNLMELTENLIEICRNYGFRVISTYASSDVMPSKIYIDIDVEVY